MNCLGINCRSRNQNSKWQTEPGQDNVRSVAQEKIWFTLMQQSRQEVKNYIGLPPIKN